MIDIITQRASLVGQVITDLTYEELRPQKFKVELVGLGKSAQYKLGGFFVFSDLPSGNYTLRISGKRFQRLEYPVTIPPSELVIDSPGDNEVFVIVRTIDNTTQRITFDPVILNKEIRVGASVQTSGFSTSLAAKLDVGRITQARLNDTVGLTADSIVRIRRDASLRLKFDPYYSFPPGLTRISGKVVLKDAPSIPPSAPKIPLKDAQVRLTQVNGVNVVLNNVAGVNIATVNIDGTLTILGAEKDITTLTNQQGDYILYFRGGNLPATFTNVTLEGTLTGYQTETQTASVSRGQRNTIELQLEKV
jgi:hypothetical protein